MVKKLQIIISDDMGDTIDKVMIEDRFDNVSEFVRQCIRVYFKDREAFESDPLPADYDHWQNVQQVINKLPSEELLGLMTCNVSVEKTDRIARNEIIKRIYVKLFKNDNVEPVAPIEKKPKMPETKRECLDMSCKDCYYCRYIFEGQCSEFAQLRD